jgi:hypothetical protein
MTTNERIAVEENKKELMMEVLAAVGGEPGYPARRASAPSCGREKKSVGYV